MRIPWVPRLAKKVSRIDGLLAIERELRSLLDSRLKPLGVTYAQIAILRYIDDPIDRYERPLPRPIRVTDVSAWFCYAPRTMTDAIGVLHKKGLLEKASNPADRRSTLLVVSALGKDLLRESEPIINKTEGQMSRELSSSYDNALEYMINSLRRSIGRSANFDRRRARKR